MVNRDSDVACLMDEALLAERDNLTGWLSGDEGGVTWCSIVRTEVPADLEINGDFFVVVYS